MDICSHALILKEYKMNYHVLEFNRILEQASEFAMSQGAKEAILSLKPKLCERECKRAQKDTSDAKIILETLGNPPLVSMNDLNQILELARKGAMLSAKNLTTVANFIYHCNRMSVFLKKAEHMELNLAYVGIALLGLEDLQSEIETAIRNDRVQDHASKKLGDIRRKIEGAKGRAKVKLDALLKSKREYLSDGNIVSRDGRFALPVKREYRGQVPGTVVGTSSKGTTVFIEPSSVSKLQREIIALEIQEEMEISIILYTLSSLVDDNADILDLNMGYMENLDFVFAKAKYSQSIAGIEAQVFVDREIKIIKGRHPLIRKDECVPLDFAIGVEYTGVVITGPNTGGKTVALKTIGLLSMMAQCGLHVPCQEDSVFSMRSNILCDIGDGQSISANLSTFSAHIKNVIEILQNVSEESLVLLDELGSGTDPAEGMGIAVSILEELKEHNCLFVATTHYPEIKEYAKVTPNLINARMEFDQENLKPLYKLEIGEAGESCALSIAERLGLPAHMLERARCEAYKLPYESGNRKTISKKPSKLKRDVKKELKMVQFNTGDSVTVLSSNDIGIVYKPANNKGDYIVQVKGEKQVYNHVRLKLRNKAEELYPDDYDFSIIFDTVSNRKARNKLDKGNSDGHVIIYGELD